MRVITTTGLMRPIADFSHAAMVENVVFVGAMAGTDANTVVAGQTPGATDFRAQTRKIFENLDAVLGQYGSETDDLQRLKVYLSDMRNYATYMTMFEERFPRADFDHVVVGSNGYPLPQAVIELDAVAAVPGSALAFEFTSMRLRLRGRRRDEFPDIVESAVRQLNRPLDRLVFAGVTAVSTDCLDEIFSALLATTGDNAPPMACRASMLGDYEIDAVVELIFARTPPILGPRSDKGLDPAYAVSGQFAFLSGREPADVSADVKSQMSAVMSGIEKTLGEIGFPSRSLIRTRNFLTDWRDYGVFNSVYKGFVDWPFPPRTTMLAGLRSGAQFQLEGVAYRRPSDVTVLQVPKLD